MNVDNIQTLASTVIDRSLYAANLLHLRLARPVGFQFEPGQAVNLCLPDRSTGEWGDGQPFTVVSRPNDPDLEFCVRIYRDGGFTERLEGLRVGDAIRLSRAFGELAYLGPGLMIAGGSGVTPFLAMLRHQRTIGSATGNFLLYSEQHHGDFICREELNELLSSKLRCFVTRENAGPTVGRITDEVLSGYVTPDTCRYYLCGPPDMVEELGNGLVALGVDAGSLVVERALVPDIPR